MIDSSKILHVSTPLIMALYKFRIVIIIVVF